MQQVVEALAERGIDAAEVDENGVLAIEVPCRDDGTPDCGELLEQIDAWLAESGLPFVPENAGDRIYIRPAAS